MRGIHYFFRISCHPCYAFLTGGTFGEIQITTDVTYTDYIRPLDTKSYLSNDSNDIKDGF